jgi:ribonuclease HI
MTHPLLTIHTDGASRGNPGKAAYAYIIERHGGDLIEEAGCLGELTNNQAEYEALVRALHHALELGTGHSIQLNSDSELLIKQMKGEYRVKNHDLLPLYEDARGLVKRFEGVVKFRHIPREENKRADELCNEALDGKRLGRVDPSEWQKPAPRPASSEPKPVETIANRPGLEAQAIACLRQAAADGATPEETWKRICRMLAGRNIVLPR